MSASAENSPNGASNMTESPVDELDDTKLQDSSRKIINTIEEADELSSPRLPRAIPNQTTTTKTSAVVDESINSESKTTAIPNNNDNTSNTENSPKSVRQPRRSVTEPKRPPRLPLVRNHSEDIQDGGGKSLDGGGPSTSSVPSSPTKGGFNASSSGGSSPLKTLARKMRRSSGESRDSESPVREVLVGTPVKEGHKNYVLMFDMLTGIRISVSRQTVREEKEVYLADYAIANKLAFDESGVELMPTKQYDFKFKDYAPWVFKNIRDLFNVDPQDYLHSLTGKYVLSELGSPGKSGSFFYFSADYRFIIKTVHHDEHKFMRKILPQYYNHVKNNTNTLLSRILGLHRVKQPGNKKIHFVVMGNVFPPHKDIHEIYDLKGSLAGREIGDEEILASPTAVMKDLNWVKRDKQLILGPTKKTLLEEQLDKDVAYLKQNKIMDYSLLVGIHDMIKGNKEFVREKSLMLIDTPILVDPDGKTTMKRVQRSRTGDRFKKRTRTTSDPQALTPNNSKLSDAIPPERRNVVFYQDFGGYQSTGEEDNIRPLIYYIGIIDIFTKFGKRKKAESFFKGLLESKEEISCTRPDFYAKRFLEFVKKTITGADFEDQKW